jgi:hypothetical protein
MEAYHFKAVVEPDGSIVLSGLPPSQEVEILVVERKGLAGEIRSWFQDIRTRHPFAQMSKEEILMALQKTRETVWAERHAN